MGGSHSIELQWVIQSLCERIQCMSVYSELMASGHA